MGLDIADFQLPIFDWSFRQHQSAIKNQKSAIPRPIRYREMVLAVLPTDLSG
jgi:hypothetical protein